MFDKIYDHEMREQLTMAMTIVYYHLFNCYVKLKKKEAESNVNSHPIARLFKNYFGIPRVLKMRPMNVSFDALQEAALAFAKYDYYDISFLIIDMIPINEHNEKWNGTRGIWKKVLG